MWPDSVVDHLACLVQRCDARGVPVVPWDGCSIIIIIIKNVKIRVTMSWVTLQGHFTQLLKSHRQKRNELQPENEVSVTPVSVQTAMSSRTVCGTDKIGVIAQSSAKKCYVYTACMFHCWMKSTFAVFFCSRNLSDVVVKKKKKKKKGLYLMSAANRCLLVGV